MSNEHLAELKEYLFGESTVAKIWGVAASKLDDTVPPTEFPEYSYGRYTFRELDYWTSGFFPGSIYALLERRRKHPNFFPRNKIHDLKLEFAAKWWAESLIGESSRTDTHDLGFMIFPAFQRQYELTKDEGALKVLITAANALASRFDETVGCIRSWDIAVNKRYNFSDTTKDYMVIIDNMCNLDMLYYVASKTGDLRLSSIATKHAETTLKHHFRYPEWSCYHVINYNRRNGEVIAGFTNQGYSDDSAWSRGQAWGVLGYIDSYIWTKNKDFLDASKSLADFFLSKLEEDGVPAWDFAAPDKHIKDVSAGMVTALGLLKLYEVTKEEKYLNSALELVTNCLKLAYNPGASISEDGTVELGEKDTILGHSTVNNNPDAIKQIFNHGLVYADYYFLMVGNKLLDLGLYN